MKNFTLIISIVLICFTFNLNGQNIYGYTGLIKTPNAYTIEDGKANLAIQLYDDIYRTFDKEKTTILSQSINIGFLSRLEVGVRLVSYPSRSGKGHDRILNFKLVLFKEKNYIPQISFGCQDVVGTRIYNSTYMVLSKNIAFSKDFHFIPSLGYGSKISDKIFFDDSYDHRLVGVFGNAEISYKDWISGMLEYDGNYYNFGIRCSPFKFISITTYMNDIKYFGGIINLSLKI